MGPYQCRAMCVAVCRAGAWGRGAACGPGGLPMHGKPGTLRRGAWWLRSCGPPHTFFCTCLPGPQILPRVPSCAAETFSRRATGLPHGLPRRLASLPGCNGCGPHGPVSLGWGCIHMYLSDSDMSLVSPPKHPLFQTVPCGFWRYTAA